jgi:N-methylhydantoinase B
MVASGFDAVTLEILWKRMISAVDEASAALIRTAFSTVVRESYDFACVITDPQGQLLAQATQSIPSFIGTLPRTVRFFVERFPLETLRPGDVLICNNPWFGTGHLPDINVARPIFKDGKLVGFAASTAHAPDIGGRTGSRIMRDVFEEGFQIPPWKLIDDGKLDETLIALLRTNVRAPDAVVGDLFAQVTALDVIERRLGELMDEYGLVTLTDLGREIHDRSEAAMRASIAKIPQGTYRYQLESDGLAVPILIKIAVTFDGHDCVVDFEDLPDQLDGTSLNSVYAYTYAYTSYGLKCMLAPDLPNNDGVWRPIIINAREGSVLNHRYPTSGFSRHMIGHYLPTAAIAAMATIIPDRVMAPSGTPIWDMQISGVTAAGKSYANLFFFNGGMGANCRHDGPSVLSWPSNVSCTPIEYIERLVPLRVERKTFRIGSGGAGKHHGGLGLEVAFRVSETSPINVTFAADRTRSGPDGIVGGAPGAAGEIRINDSPPIDTKQAYVLRAGDRVVIRTPGGGGFGSPTERPETLICHDQAAGYVPLAAGQPRITCGSL